MRLLLCAPTHFKVAYEINPWMDVQNPVQWNEASESWDKLKNKLSEIGFSVRFIEPKNTQPDMCFTANGGLIYKNKAVLSKFKFPERQGEEECFKKWFEENNYEVLEPPCNFEGAGDALFAGDNLFVGHGFRSDKEAAPYLAQALGVNVISCHLIDPYFYHLDTCFCPLNDKQALIFPGAFDNKTLDLLNCLELIEVSEEDARRFACNAVVLNKDIVMPWGCIQTAEVLGRMEYKIHEIPINQFILAGGACKCLTLQL
jgi:N-dimethylarginine dimethylaminohydrolase